MMAQKFYVCAGEHQHTYWRLEGQPLLKIERCIYVRKQGQFWFSTG